MAENCKENDGKRRCFSIQDRAKILERLENGERVVDIAVEYGVNKSTISSMKRRKDDILKIKEVLESCDADIQQRKRFRGTEITPFEMELYNWYLSQRQIGLSITGNALQQKALELNTQYNGPENFKASHRWLDNFKKRHGMCKKDTSHNPIHQDDKNIDTEDNKRFKLELENLMSLYTISLDRVYNCSEIPLSWKLLPKKYYDDKNRDVFSTDDTYTKSLNQDRVTVITCANVLGSHKLPLYIIGKNKNPSCFQGLKNLPTQYYSQQNCLVDSNILIHWYTNIFVPEVKKTYSIDKNNNFKIILIIDRSSSLASQHDFSSIADFCTVLILPTSVSSSIIPSEQGIIEQFKINYRKLFLSRLFANDVDNIDNTDSLLAYFTLLDCLKCCKRAWDQVGLGIIRNSWKNMISFMEKNSNFLFQSDNRKFDAKAFTAFIRKLPRCSSIQLQDTINYLNADKSNDPWFLFDYNHDGIAEFDKKIPSHFNTIRSENISTNKALESINTVINWYEDQADCESSVHKMLENLHEDIIGKIIAKKYN